MFDLIQKKCYVFLWGHSYPGEDLIRSDIQKNACKIIYDEHGIHGVFALFDGAEPTYAHIENGRWPNDKAGAAMLFCNTVLQNADRASDRHRIIDHGNQI